MHIIAAKAICFGEALKPEFKEYQEQVIKNAKALAQAMIDEGFNLVSGGTDNHLMLVDLQNMNITGKELQNRLDEVYITVNKNAVPNDPASPFVTSGIRIGTPAVTTRGLKEEDMKTIAKLIKMTVTDFDTKADEIRAAVNEICGKLSTLCLTVSNATDSNWYCTNTQNVKEEKTMELKTPLYDAHVKAGGKIVEFGGYLLPVQYGTGVIKEHMSYVHRQDFSCLTYGEVLCEGKDATGDLNQILTNVLPTW